MARGADPNAGSDGSRDGRGSPLWAARQTGWDQEILDLLSKPREAAGPDK